MRTARRYHSISFASCPSRRPRSACERARWRSRLAASAERMAVTPRTNIAAANIAPTASRRGWRRANLRARPSTPRRRPRIGSPTVPGELPAALQPLATQMKSSPRATAAISGYHSATGDAAANHELAKSRAANVRDALVAAGVPAQRLVIEQPLVEQANVVGEDPKARRVEVTVK